MGWRREGCRRMGRFLIRDEEGGEGRGGEGREESERIGLSGWQRVKGRVLEVLVLGKVDLSSIICGTEGGGMVCYAVFLDRSSVDPFVCGVWYGFAREEKAAVPLLCDSRVVVSNCRWRAVLPPFSVRIGTLLWDQWCVTRARPSAFYEAGS